MPRAPNYGGMKCNLYRQRKTIRQMPDVVNQYVLVRCRLLSSLPCMLVGGRARRIVESAFEGYGT